MSDRMLLRRDDYNGCTLTMDWGTDDQTFRVITEWDSVAPTIEENALKRSAGREYYARDPDMWKVASIPNGVIMEWLTKHGVNFYDPNHAAGVRRLLNSADYRYLKTADVII